MKILAEIDLNRPLLRGTKLKFSEKEVWVEFKYENLALFCFYCGQIGHSERLCWVKKRDADSGKIRAEQYGDWLKADLRHQDNNSTIERLRTRLRPVHKSWFQWAGAMKGCVLKVSGMKECK